MRILLGLLLVIISLFILIRCSDHNQPDANSCGFTSSQTIEVPATTSITYKIHDIFEPTNVFVAYHYPTHSIDVIDLASGHFIKKIPLERTGPQSVAQVLSLYVPNLDSIFLLTSHQIICMDQKGEISLSLRINQKNNDITGLDYNRQKIWCNPDHNQPIYYSSHYKSLYVGLKSMEEASPEKYKEPLAGRISLETRQFDPLPIYYPDIFKKAYYGILDNPHLVFFDDYTIVGFGALYDLYRYPHQPSQPSSFGWSSDYITSQAGPMNVTDSKAAFTDFRKMIAYTKANPHLYKLRINREHMRLYQLYIAPDNPDRERYRTISTFSLTEDSRECRKIEEFVVDRDRYMTKLFVPGSQGLGLIDQSSTDDLLKLAYRECGN